MSKKVGCRNCGHLVEITKPIAWALKHGSKLFCTRCGKQIIKKSDEPPTPEQLRYMQDLGGSIMGISTNGQASRKIDELKAVKFGYKKKSYGGVSNDGY